ncbi:hypothetical protein SFC88_01055 [Nocardioides sp. HM23]|uniref:hypothetical protein n=1 Tax=Nocardioides bizhenqiangii TaxID=3095076 RepID=UPI002ACA7BF0|nr:hypothetical protein [Nocardioides sp. HM23]MDZ5619390.1 hypothetical protein [Nocardioides sp. HM23]
MNLFPGRTLAHKRILVACLAAVMLTATASSGEALAPAPSVSPPAVSADGQHDFDWELGVWRSDVRVLADPLSGSEDEWLRFRGTSVVRPLMDGRANVVEFDVSGEAGRIEALNLRLYEPQADRWSSTFVSMRDGVLQPSVHGGFHDGVGEFYGKDQLGGRPIDVRFLIFRLGPDKARFEQAFSDDGGATWETNWIAVDRRVHR